LANDGCERGIAHFQRIAPHVGAVQLDQVESVEEYTIVVAIPAPASARAASRLGRRGLCRGLARRTYCDADLDRAGRPPSAEQSFWNGPSCHSSRMPASRMIAIQRS
jgi:hypothetical protein